MMDIDCSYIWQKIHYAGHKYMNNWLHKQAKGTSHKFDPSQTIQKVLSSTKI